MYCQNCGRQIKKGTIFCPYCGAKQTASQSRPTQQSQFQMNSGVRPVNVRSHHRKLIAVIGIIVVLILCFVGYKHSPLSVNLKSELPSNTWRMSAGGNSESDVKFHHSYMSEKGQRINEVTFVPEGRHTAKMIVHTQTDDGYPLTGQLNYKVRGGNENSFTMKCTGDGTATSDGRSVKIKDYKVHYHGHTEKMPQTDIDDMKSVKLTQE